MPDSKYSYNVYGPLKRYPADKFEVSNDRFMFIKFAKRFEKEKDFADFITYTALKNGKVPYIRSIANEGVIREFEDTFYVNKNRTKYLFRDYVESCDVSEWKTNGVDYPEIVSKAVLSDEIFIDIFAILDIILNLSARYTGIFKDDLFFSEKLNIYLRYRSLLEVSSDDLLYYKKLVKRKLA